MWENAVNSTFVETKRKNLLYSYGRSYARVMVDALKECKMR